MNPTNGTVRNSTNVSVRLTNPSKCRNRNTVLAERNHAVIPVGAWVDGGPDSQEEHPAVRAIITEELLEEKRREKEQNLRRFQGEVRRRVAQQALVRKSRQLEKSYDTVQRGARILQQSSDAAQRFTPRKNLHPSSPNGQLAIGSPTPHWVKANSHECSDGEHSTQAEDQQHRHQSCVMRQVRHRLAACRTVDEGEVVSELPGGIWNVSPTRDKPMSRYTRDTGREDQKEEDDEEEGIDISLTGHHNCPLVQQNIHPYEDQGNKMVTFDRSPVCERMLRKPNPTGHRLGSTMDDRVTQVLWPQDDKEELKRQRQSQFLMYRRLVMDIERGQVQEQQRHRKHLKRITRIKAEKEEIRLDEERKMKKLQQLEEDKLALTEREFLVLERLRMEEEERKEAIEKSKTERKEKEATRYIEALRAQMKEKIVQEKVQGLPPLCCCGTGFWDAHPDTCANNCVFYHNPKAYVQALRCALMSCDLKYGIPAFHHKVSAHRLASMHPLSPRK